MKKVTKKENFGKIIEVLKASGREDLVPVMEHEIELIEKKANSGKMTKTQTANEEIKEFMVAEMTRIARPVSITDLLKESPELAEKVGNSNQKVSALMTQLKNAKVVVRTQDKKTALFSINEDLEPEDIED